MKPLLLLCLLVLGFSAYAQPDLDRNYCGFAPNDSIDLTNDGIPDVVVQGFRSGTDDEPSSSGTCMLQVVNLPGTTLLSDLDGSGHRRFKVFAQGDNIKPLDTSRRDDLHIPRLAYVDASIQVAYWGYGHQSAPPTFTPGLSAQHFVFLTQGKGQAWHGSFTVASPIRTDQVRIHVGTLLPVDTPFVIR